MRADQWAEDLRWEVSSRVAQKLLLQRADRGKAKAGDGSVALLRWQCTDAGTQFFCLYVEREQDFQGE